MKVVAGALACLLALSSTIHAECLSVEVITPQKSSPNVRITVLRDGKPVRGAQVTLAVNGTQLNGASTDDHGSAAFRELVPGRYLITALDSGGLGADLVLDVSECPGQKASSFSLTLGVRPPAPPTEEDVIAAAERQQIRDRVRKFEGLIEDISGAKVADAKIRIFPRGFHDKAHAVEITSGPDGRFSAPLLEGTYIVLFQSQGFKTDIAAIEVSQSGEPKGLKIILQVGMCT